MSSRFTFVYDHPVIAQISRYENPSAFSTSALTSCGFSWPSASAPWRSRSSRSACSCVTAAGAGRSRNSPSSVTGECRSRWRRSANASCFTTVLSQGISSSSLVRGRLRQQDLEPALAGVLRVLGGGGVAPRGGEDLRAVPGEQVQRRRIDVGALRPDAPFAHQHDVQGDPAPPLPGGTTSRSQNARVFSSNDPTYFSASTNKEPTRNSIISRSGQRPTWYSHTSICRKPT